MSKQAAEHEAIRGSALIGAAEVTTEETFQAFDPATGAALEPRFAVAGTREVEAACALADAAFPSFSETDPETRAGPGSGGGGHRRSRPVPHRTGDGRDRAAPPAPGGRAGPHGRPAPPVRGSRPVGRMGPGDDRSGAAGAAAAAAAGPAPAPCRDRARGGVRGVELPARLLGGGGRHRLGPGGRLPGRGEGSPRPSRNRADGGTGPARGLGRLRPARGRVLLPAGTVERPRRRAGRRSPDQGRGLHRVARGRARADAGGGPAVPSRSRSMPR
jgi:hypothetical protein